MSDSAKFVVPLEAVEATIQSFTELDEKGDKRTMNQMARRLGKDQPALLQFAARIRMEHGDGTGEAAVFYGALVWAMFERHFGKRLPRLLPQNLTDAQKVLDEERAQVDGMDDRPIHEQVAPGVAERQPHILKKLQELIEEDVREEAFDLETARVIVPSTQVVVEAFDAAVSQRRPGQNLAPIVREQPKIGRNDPCPCGSGKKYKRCCGQTAVA